VLGYGGTTAAAGSIVLEREYFFFVLETSSAPSFGYEREDFFLDLESRGASAAEIGPDSERGDE
jgi:hypothetical protein